MFACGDAVLPEAAAPFLTFDRAVRPELIWDVFGIASQWSPGERERLSCYRMIGADGSGNPLCIEHGTGAIVLLDKEDRFHTRQLINSSTHQLGECLLAYMGETNPDRFLSAVQAIDPAAMAAGTFWWHAASAIAAK